MTYLRRHFFSLFILFPISLSAQTLEVIIPDTNFVMMRSNGDIHFDPYNQSYFDYEHKMNWKGDIDDFHFDFRETSPQLKLKNEFEKVLVYLDSSKRDTLIIAYPKDYYKGTSTIITSSGSIPGILYDPFDTLPYPIRKRRDSLARLADTLPSPRYSLDQFDKYKEFYPNGQLKLKEWTETRQYKKKKWGAYAIEHSNAWYENGQRRWKKSHYSYFCLQDSAWHANGTLRFYFDLNHHDTLIRVNTYPDKTIQKRMMYYCPGMKINKSGCIKCDDLYNKPILLSYLYYDSSGQMSERWPLSKVETYIGENDLTFTMHVDSSNYYMLLDYYGDYSFQIGDTIFSIQCSADNRIGDTVIVYYDRYLTDTAIVSIFSRFPDKLTGDSPFKKESWKYDRAGNLIAYFNLKERINKGWYSNGNPKWDLNPLIYKLGHYYRNHTIKEKTWHSNGKVRHEHLVLENDTVVVIFYHSNGAIKSKSFFVDERKKTRDDLYYWKYKKKYFEHKMLQYVKVEVFWDNGQIAWIGYNDKKGDPLHHNYTYYHKNGVPNHVYEYYGKYPYGSYRQFHENGQLHITGQYSMNLPEPITKRERKNPQLYAPKMIKSESYKIGIWKYWDENGNLLIIENYKDGLVDQLINYEVKSE